jgi:hypothetical protein
MGVRTIALWAILGAVGYPALAQEEDSSPDPEAPVEAEEEEEEAEVPPALDLSSTDFARAAEAPDLTDSQIKWLRPKRHLMGQNPRAQNDFTAYSLEWGEVKVGLGKTTLGILPRVQLGTVPVMWGLKVQNGQAKVNAVRFGGLDLSVEGSYFGIPLDNFTANYKALGGGMSFQIVEKWSIHGRLNKAWFLLEGPPTGLKGVSDRLASTPGALTTYLEELGDDSLISVKADALVVNLATDYRFNRRDSLILQVQAMLGGSVCGALTIPPILGLDEAFDIEKCGYVANASEAYLASVAWHSAWKRWEIRLGAGISSQPGAWAFQAMDLSYRFGGETRNTERRTRRTWRGNRKDGGEGDQED